MRYWNMARQRYCCGLARCWRALRLSADRAENAARKRALFGALIEESGSHMTRRWREMDSNPRSPATGITSFETARGRLYRDLIALRKASAVRWSRRETSSIPWPYTTRPEI